MPIDKAASRNGADQEKKVVVRKWCKPKQEAKIHLWLSSSDTMEDLPLESFSGFSPSGPIKASACAKRKAIKVIKPRQRPSPSKPTDKVFYF